MAKDKSRWLSTREACDELGITLRTLYRIIQDWKLQDKIRQAITLANGNIEDTARSLAMKPAALQSISVRGCATVTTRPAAAAPSVAPASPPAPSSAKTRLARPTSKASPASSQNCSVTRLAINPVHT